MDKHYIDNCTDQWKLLDSEGSVELWQYHDKVDWDTQYAIKVNGDVKTSFSDGNPYRIFSIVSKCI